MAVISGSGTGTPTNVAASATSVTILAANPARQGATVYNDSAAATLYLLLGSSAASTTSYSAQVTAGSYYEAPSIYRGPIQGIWSAADGAARVTELT